ncbi:isoleucine--tRNA ligase [Mycoplasma hyorhinis]|uniref:isoleucine--tRNA ligase n=1 Tax=Mesomycoplasma hyorhinis TaxID=2100 RepID=UPI001370EFDF|nr:isoleucine--tRNA ligase [Mesomycoplasma hyorhinis]MXR07538.1 isoleucine--tRNA ligase [Mesomycoplasma hyorhinis]
MDKNFYKNSLNIFTSEFSMKANLSQKEAEYRQFWLDNKIYQKALKLNENNPQFVLHDGPPYANGDIHIGHALNKVLKDIVVRYKTMQGFYSPYVPGWDTHGLPIENKILSLNNISHKSLSVLELRKQANNYANEQIESQKKQFEQLNLLTDFSTTYQTNAPTFEAKQLELFKVMVQKDLVYRGLKPVYWSPTSQSALAEAEIEYLDHRSPSIYVAFEISQGNSKVTKGDYLVIWTTTPWTLIANSGVAVGEKFEYSKVKHQDKFFVVATELVEKLAQEFNWDHFEIVDTFLGEKLVDVKYIRPIMKEKEGKVVQGHHVTVTSGSGLVHIAPLFGEDDFWISKKTGLEHVMHVNDDGTLNELARKYEGLFYLDANKEIGQDLEKEGKLLKFSILKHSYPHDWRTNKPVIYRGTPQWFVAIEKIKSEILKASEEVIFPQEWIKRRLQTMIENRQDWTISRQRSWGVPIIVFYDENKNPVLDKPELFDYVINLVKQYGTDVWYEKEVDELLPEEYRNLGWTKENDIMDVWFDSGSTSISVKVDKTELPFDLYLEGSDQYRGWFNSSLINSYIYYNKAPYRRLLSHGFIVDQNGNKMSKSKGNGVSPLDLIKTYGADILRLWVSNSEYFNDVVYSKDIFEQNVEIYRKIRNTIKFLITNLEDYKHNPNLQLESVHQYIDNKIKKFKNTIIDNYDNFRFVKIIKEANNFIIDFSNFYLSIAKDSLYTDKLDNPNRRQFQYNLYNLLNVLTISLAPILPTTTEEIYSYIKSDNKKESVHLETFFKKEAFDEKIEEKWKEFFTVKDRIYQLIEQKIKEGVIKRTNEAFIHIKTDSEFIKSLDLKSLLMVGKVHFANKDKVEPFNSVKCLRCWNHFEAKYIKKDVCQRCYLVIKDLINEN